MQEIVKKIIEAAATAEADKKAIAHLDFEVTENE